MSDTIYTCGHSTLPIDEFLGLLTGNGIALLVDVRTYPASRRHPHFCRGELERYLTFASIRYRWAGPSLGGRRPNRSDTAWENASFGGYARWMEEPEFERGLQRLEELARQAPTAYMCSERHHSQCHRRLLSDVLLARGWRVIHLRQDGVEDHTMTPWAVVQDGQVSYPKAQLSLGEAA